VTLQPFTGVHEVVVIFAVVLPLVSTLYSIKSVHMDAVSVAAQKGDDKDEVKRLVTVGSGSS
jgi:phosphoenolpyruvate carboxylase